MSRQSLWILEIADAVFVWAGAASWRRRPPISGLVDEVVPADALLDRVRALADVIAAKSPVALRLTKGSRPGECEDPTPSGAAAGVLD